MSGMQTPSVARSRLWRHIAEAAAAGAFRLQVCAACQRVQYPPQEFCSQCLVDDLPWQDLSPLGEVLSWTSLRVSNNEFFRDKLPVNTGLVKLDCGPVMLCYLAASCRQRGSRVQVTARPDQSGQSVFFAGAPDTDPGAEFNRIMMHNDTGDEA